MKEISGIVVSDIHFGVMNAKQLFEELDEILIRHLQGLEKLDVIFLAGDYFDHLLSVNEDHFVYSSRFMEKLVKEAKRLGSCIRIVYGTESHECNQYDYITPWCQDIDYRVIKQVCEETLECGLHVLYLPEEYIHNKKEYYKDYIDEDKEYDYVIGHGTIQELMPSAKFVKKNNGNSNRAKVPVFNSNELSTICKGDVFFGHYHIHSTMNENVHYCGSFSRWIFGEEEKKGFYYFQKKGKKYHREFIENTFCKKLNTIHIGYQNKIFSNPNTFRQEIQQLEQKIKDDLLGDKVKLSFHIPEDYTDAESIILYLTEKFKDNERVKLEIVNGFVKKRQSINKEYLKESINKYGVIFDHSIPIEDKASEFIKKKYNEEITPERIRIHLGIENHSE